MKKLLFLTNLFCALSTVLNGQTDKLMKDSSGRPSPELKTASTPTLVLDTLHYYFNKVVYKNGVTQISSFPFFKSGPNLTDTTISHCGSRFDVPLGDSVIVSGAEAYVQKYGTYMQSVNTSVHLYLFNLNAQGLPVFPAIDSIQNKVGYSASISPTLIGGNFINTHVMKGSYAILIRSLSLIHGDTISFYRTAGATAASSANLKYKYGDTENAKDYGFVRYKGIFYSSKDFVLASGFGTGTQYEFIVAPRISYYIQASHLCPAGVESGTSTATPSMMCTRQIMTFTNTSSEFYEHRMYNLNSFYLKWVPGSGFMISPPGGWSPDSAITWSFEYYDAAVPPIDSRIFLPYNNNGTITSITDLASDPDCFTLNQFRARLRPMGAFNKRPQLQSNESFTLCLKYCNGDALNIAETEGFNFLKIYPNPSLNKKIKMTGLTASCTVQLYDPLGRCLSKQLTVDPEIELDLSKYQPGTYFIRIEDKEKRSKTFKLILQD